MLLIEFPSERGRSALASDAETLALVHGEVDDIRLSEKRRAGDGTGDCCRWALILQYVPGLLTLLSHPTSRMRTVGRSVSIE